MARGTRVDINLDRAKIKQMLHSTSNNAARRAAYATRDQAKRNLTTSGRIDTGRLRDSIRASRKRTRGTTVTWSVGTPLQYGLYQEKGIGPVTPVKAKALRFKPKGSNTFVFAQRTKGFSGAFYLKRAYQSIKVSDFLP